MYKCEKCGNIHNFTQKNLVYTKIELSDNGKTNNMKAISTDCLLAYCTDCGNVIYTNE